MLPLARKALTLVFLISSSNRGGGGGQHGASPSFLVEALPLDNKPPSNSDTGTKHTCLPFICVPFLITSDFGPQVK